MKILSIETSCDETAVSIVEASGGLENPTFTVLGNALFSQIELHQEYGGVFPTLAKREHTKNLPPLLIQALKEACECQESEQIYSDELWSDIEKILVKEHGLFEHFKGSIGGLQKPPIDLIAVTSGPGLEPALWVGISFALALGRLWGLPVVPVNHMEGHIASVLLTREMGQTVQFPALALLISGGHTEIVDIQQWGQYRVIGQTRDDAVGEAFDKVARMLGLPYPGGPEISKLAEKARTENHEHVAHLPRPMIHADNFDFSFSGLKTAVLYYIRDHSEPDDIQKADIAREFEDAVVDVLLEKTKKALLETAARTLIVAGGVIANKKIKEAFTHLGETEVGLSVITPTHNMSTDNSVMIAMAGYIDVTLNPEIMAGQSHIVASGNLLL